MKKEYVNLNPEPHITIIPTVMTLEEAQYYKEFLGDENTEIRETYNAETREFIGYMIYDKE
jgi:hypothetical protein